MFQKVDPYVCITTDVNELLPRYAILWIQSSVVNRSSFQLKGVADQPGRIYTHGFESCIRFRVGGWVANGSHHRAPNQRPTT